MEGSPYSPSPAITSAKRQCGPCTGTSDNKHFDCPPRMSDGRIFTDYSSRCDLNFVTHLNQSGKTMDSYKYRQFLLQNADKLMSDIRSEVNLRTRCGPCMEPFESGTMLSEKEQDVCDDRTCARKLIGNGHGIGVGRSYGNQSAFQADYDESRKRKQMGMPSQANCCGTKSDYDNYFAPEGVVPETSINRYASVGGGTPLTGGDLISR